MKASADTARFVPHPPLGEKMCDVCLHATGEEGMTFSQEGDRFLCRDCTAYFASPPDRADLRRQWQVIMEEERGAGEYDFLLAYSGGADSTAALKLLVNQYHLKVLAFTIDNGMKPRSVWDNITAVTRRLGVDWYYINDINRAGSKIVTALSDSTHVCGAVCRDGWKEPNYQRVMRSFGGKVVLTGLEIPANGLIRFPRYPHLVAFMAAHMMNKSELLSYISDLPWKQPGFRQGFDTDCLGGGFGLELFRYRFRRHAPIVIRFLSERIRHGLLDRDEELGKLNEAVRDEDWEFLEARFGPVRKIARARSDVPDAAGIDPVKR